MWWLIHMHINESQCFTLQMLLGSCDPHWTQWSMQIKIALTVLIDPQISHFHDALFAIINSNSIEMCMLWIHAIKISCCMKKIKNLHVMLSSQMFDTCIDWFQTIHVYMRNANWFNGIALHLINTSHCIPNDILCASSTTNLFASSMWILFASSMWIDFDPSILIGSCDPHCTRWLIYINNACVLMIRVICVPMWNILMMLSANTIVSIVMLYFHQFVTRAMYDYGVSIHLENHTTCICYSECV